jgi:O-phosphoseryl-tRNA(Cys) synthetase
MTTSKYHALVWQEIDMWIGQCIEIDVASCGETEDKATRNLIKALEQHFDDPGHCHVRHYSFSMAPMRRSMRAHLVEIEIAGH